MEVIMIVDIVISCVEKEEKKSYKTMKNDSKKKKSKQMRGYYNKGKKLFLSLE